MNIFIIGSGTFGTAIANELATNLNNDVMLYCRSIDKVNEINISNSNLKYFPNKKLNNRLIATNKIEDINNYEIVFIALPSSVLINSLDKFQKYISKDHLLVNLSKGIFKNGITIVDFLEKKFNTKNVVSLKGPSFAVEIMENSKTLLTLGYSNDDQLKKIKKIFLKSNIYIDSTKDIRGVEILSVIKNIYALIMGIIDAKYNSPNTRFMFLSKIFSEIRLLNTHMNGELNTLFLACGLGDVCLTSLNDLSRNRTLGLLIGKGFYEPNSKENTVVIEGLNSINTIFSMLDEVLIEQLPLLNKLNSFFNSQEKRFIIDFNDFFKD